MSKLYELLAVEADLNNTAKAMIAEAIVTFTKKTEHFMGMSRAVTYFDEGRSGENTSDSKPLVSTVPERLDYTFGHVGRYWDALLQKELANQAATADLEVEGTDGFTITNVPATFLLAIESRLDKLREVVASIPTLDPNTAWVAAPDDGQFIFKAPAKTTFTTEKVLEYKTVAPATDKHPAQVKEWTSDVRVARIETLLTSGAVTPADKSEMLARVDNLLASVKKARSRANGVEVERRHVADQMLGYILGWNET